MRATSLGFIFFLVLPLSLASQVSVEVDSANLELLSVTPDLFPQVTIQLRAQDNAGDPIWELPSSSIIVIENSDTIFPDSIRPITTPPSFDFCLVMDRSGSMFIDPSLTWFEANTLTYSQLLAKSPWNKAIWAIKDFHDQTSSDTAHRWVTIAFDNVIIVGDSLSKETDVYSSLKRYEPRDGTAFYDALNEALQHLSDTTRDRYVIALTDGMDNSSKATLSQTAEVYKESGVHLIIIGLGNVDSGKLRSLAAKSNGYYVHSKTADELQSVYNELAERIKAIHEVYYTSVNMASKDSSRTLLVRYQTEGLYSKEELSSFNVPSHMISQMRSVEEDLAFRKKRNKWILISSGGLLFIAAGLFAFRKLSK